MTDLEISSTLRERLQSLQSRVTAACARCGRKPDDVTLVAVTKSVSNRVAAILPTLGVVDLGESRPQELWKKAEIPGVRWHFIGHLQRNKLDKTIPLVSLVHSVDSERLLQSLHEFAVKHNRSVSVLLEVNCSGEAAKGGFEPDALPDLSGYSSLQIQGLMTMAAAHDNPQDARPTFARLRTIRDQLRTRTSLALPELSMGMSNDFEVAVEEGATLIRIGTTLFSNLEKE